MCVVQQCYNFFFRKCLFALRVKCTDALIHFLLILITLLSLSDQMSPCNIHIQVIHNVFFLLPFLLHCYLKKLAAEAVA